MGMAAVFVMCPGPFEYTFVSPSHGASTWNLTSINFMGSEEMSFENVDRRRTTDALLYCKLTYEPSAQVSYKLEWNNFKYTLVKTYVFLNLFQVYRCDQRLKYLRTFDGNATH